MSELISADSKRVKLRRLLHLTWILHFATLGLWSSPTLAQDDAFEAYRKEVIAITSKYPDHAIPNHYAGGQEGKDSIRLYRIADELFRLDPQKYPKKASQRERLSVLMKEASPALSILLVSNNKSPHLPTLIEEWLGHPTEAGKKNRERMEAEIQSAIQILETYSPSDGPRLTRGPEEREAAKKLVRAGQTLRRLNPLRYPDSKSYLTNLQVALLQPRPDLSLALSQLIQEQDAEAKKRENLQTVEDPTAAEDPIQKLEERQRKAQETIQQLRVQAHGIFVKYEATGGPRVRARLGEKEPSGVERTDAATLYRIGLKLHEIDPTHYKRTGGRENLAILFKPIPYEGETLVELLGQSVSSPHFSEKLAAWQKIRSERLNAKESLNSADASNLHLVHLVAVRQEAIQILDSYRTIGRPRTESSDATQRSAANRLNRLGTQLVKKFPEQFGSLGPKLALAKLLEESDPHGAEILKHETQSPEFKEAVRKRNGVTPLFVNAEKRILEYQKEVIAIFEKYAVRGGPSTTPADPHSPEGKREITAARRLNAISFNIGGLDPTRFLPTAQNENLARLVEDTPIGGAALARLIRARRGSESFQLRIGEWRTARRQALRKAEELPGENQVDEAPEKAPVNEAPAPSPEETYPEAVRAFLDRYASVDDILNDSLKVFREFRETGGPIEWSPAETPGQKRERSAARMLTLLNHRLHELDPAKFSDPAKLGNLARAIEKFPGEGPALAELLRTDRAKDPALHERRRKIWLAVRE